MARDLSVSCSAQDDLEETQLWNSLAAGYL